MLGFIHKFHDHWLDSIRVRVQGASRKRQRSRGYSVERLEDRTLLAAYQSPVHVWSIDDIQGDFDGNTYGDDTSGLTTPIIDVAGTSGVDPKVIDGVTLYPIDSTFGFLVEDFVGAIPKDRDGLYGEGWAGNLQGVGGEHVGVMVSDAPTDIFLSGGRLGT